MKNLLCLLISALACSNAQAVEVQSLAASYAFETVDALFPLTPFPNYSPYTQAGMDGFREELKQRCALVQNATSAEYPASAYGVYLPGARYLLEKVTYKDLKLIPGTIGAHCEFHGYGTQIPYTRTMAALSNVSSFAWFVDPKKVDEDWYVKTESIFTKDVLNKQILDPQNKIDAAYASKQDNFSKFCTIQREGAAITDVDCSFNKASNKIFCLYKVMFKCASHIELGN